MADSLYHISRTTLPPEIAGLLEEHFQDLEAGRFRKLFEHDLTRALLGRQNPHVEQLHPDKYGADRLWSDCVFDRLGVLLTDPETGAFRRHFFFIIANAALQAFLQANVTGPPLPSAFYNVLWPDPVSGVSRRDAQLRLVHSLSVDGVAAYRLTPHIELFCLADTILASPSIKKNVKAASWARLRTTFMHQRLLSETSSTLQALIYEELATIESLLRSTEDASQDVLSSFLIERAAIHTYDGFDKRARQDLDAASRRREFEFALTGRLGKRTKYQEKDTSQLVVLAESKQRSANNGVSEAEDSSNGLTGHPSSASDLSGASQPTNLDLNDDTLLEGISFANGPSNDLAVTEATSLSPALAGLDPGNQPILQALDSIILLQLASSITNTSPTDGLTREETLPYAQRVLDGGSSNWQVYTQALLVRSRNEGNRSRTVERGLLQLQALVDQVIAETSQEAQPATSENDEQTQTTTFLPRPKLSESASASERLQYIHMLSSPTRWELESELATRWTSLGGLRSALEIYERLEMWPEAALCWAATDREDKAKHIVRKQLNTPTSGVDATVDADTESWEGTPRDPVPADAPRLYCILGDIDNNIAMYEKAWEVSNGRYARAQRSLGRLYISAHDYVKAADSYTKALEVNQVNGSSWFALGCALLELAEFERAVEAFARTVQIDDTDAEAWSNLAASLLKRGPVAAKQERNGTSQEDLGTQAGKIDPQQHKHDALRAFRRAASLKYDSPRIWDNVLTVAAALSPPAYTDIVAAQSRLIEIRGKVEGESCIDADILDGLVRHVVAVYPGPPSQTAEGPNAVSAAMAPNRPGSVPALIVKLVMVQVMPLITRSARLWRAVATLSLWQDKPGSALDAQEKAWRATTSRQEGWEHGREEQWNEIVEATVQLADAYESLGPKAKIEGLAAGTGTLVAKDWRFKAKSAIRGVMGKAKSSWEDTDGWTRLQDAMDSLKDSF